MTDFVPRRRDAEEKPKVDPKAGAGPPDPLILPDAKERVDALVTKLGIPDNWDVIFVGDGSGNRWTHGCGWACVSFDRAEGAARLWHGIMNRGTVNVAEIMAYVQPLNYLVSEKAAGRNNRVVTNIHVITDSDYCRSTGSRQDRAVVLNNALWGVFDVYRRVGFQVHWHWARRMSSYFNRVADHVAGIANRHMQKLDVAASIEAAREVLENPPCSTPKKKHRHPGRIEPVGWPDG